MNISPSRVRRSAAPAFAALVLLAGLAGCSDEEPDGSSAAAPASADPTTTSRIVGSTSTTEPASVEPVEFEGTVDEFYVVPDPLPPGEPGDLIRVQAVNAELPMTMRVMYHSVDGDGDDRAVTSIVTRPVTDGPAGGWPVVVTAPGTVGLTSSCALSRRGEPAPDFGVDGIAVMTDYIGMGPVGEIHPYLSRSSEGHSVLDGVRAAMNLTGNPAGAPVLIFGHSQGGHGAASAHELAGAYAPELNVLGTVVAAPAAMFDRTYGGVDDIVSRIVTTMGIYGIATENPDVRPEDYLSPAALAVDASTKCADPIINELVPLAASPDYWKADPRTTEPGRSVLLANDVGNEVADVPMLLISGTEDQRVVHARTLDYLDRLCGNGQVTELLTLEGANHGTEVPVATPQIEQFFADRLTGVEPTNSCP